MLYYSDFTHTAGPVRPNQGYCGSCTMYTMADLMGTKAYYKWGSYRKYSVQQLVDCTYRKYRRRWSY